MTRIYECTLEDCKAPHREQEDATLFRRALCETCRTWLTIEGLAAQMLSPKPPGPITWV